jgi:hypothetical protein
MSNDELKRKVFELGRWVITVVVILGAAYFMNEWGIEDVDYPPPPATTDVPEEGDIVTYGYQTDNYSTDGGNTWVVGGTLEGDGTLTWTGTASFSEMTLTDATITDLTATNLTATTSILTTNTVTTETVTSLTATTANVTTLDVAGNVTVDGTTTVSDTFDLNGQKLDLDADADTSVTADTDDQIDWEIGGQDMISFTQAASYYLMPIYARVPSLSKTADYTLTRQLSGALIDNKGASGEITITLPSATTDLSYGFYVYEAQTITIQPATGDQVHHLTNATADRLQNAGTAGDSIWLVAIDGEFWIPLQETGTWSDAN